MLCEPALLAALPAGDAQGMAFFAEQCIAAVTGTNTFNSQFFREVHDKAALRIQVTGGMQSFDKRAFFFDSLQGSGPHARHQSHVHNDIRAVGDFDAKPCKRRIDRAHAIGDDIHCSALHGASKQRIDFAVRVDGLHPVIVRASVILIFCTDEGQVFHPGDVRGI